MTHHTRLGIPILGKEHYDEIRNLLWSCLRGGLEWAESLSSNEICSLSDNFFRMSDIKVLECNTNDRSTTH